MNKILKYTYSCVCWIALTMLWSYCRRICMVKFLNLLSDPSTSHKSILFVILKMLSVIAWTASAMSSSWIRIKAVSSNTSVCLICRWSLSIRTILKYSLTSRPTFSCLSSWQVHGLARDNAKLHIWVSVAASVCLEIATCASPAVCSFLISSPSRPLNIAGNTDWGRGVHNFLDVGVSSRYHLIAPSVGFEHLCVLVLASGHSIDAVAVDVRNCSALSSWSLLVSIWTTGYCVLPRWSDLRPLDYSDWLSVLPYTSLSKSLKQTLVFEI